VNKLQILAVLFFIAGSTVVSASDKAARRDAHEKRVTAKDKDTVKEARRYPSLGIAPVIVFTKKTKQLTN
jgi:hypothetical protein